MMINNILNNRIKNDRWQKLSSRSEFHGQPQSLVNNSQVIF